MSNADPSQRAISVASYVLAALSIACSSEPVTVGIRASQGGADASVQSTDWAGAMASDVPRASNAGTSGASHEDGLDVKVEDASHVVLRLIAVGCHGECTDVQAVATGGYPPYTFAWEDGSTQATRKLCPTDDTTFRVTATDTGVASVEFTQAPEMVTAEVDTQLTDCTSDALCIEEPALENRKYNEDGSLVDPSLGPEPWVQCRNEDGQGWYWADGTTIGADPVTGNPFNLIPFMPGPTEGAVYLTLMAHQSASHLLCEPLAAGRPYSVRFDVFARWLDAPLQAELKISTTACSQDAKTVWTARPADMAWQTHCVTFTLDQDYPQAALTLAVKDDNETTNEMTLVDNFLPVPNCDGFPEAL